MSRVGETCFLFFCFKIFAQQIFLFSILFYISSQKNQSIDNTSCDKRNQVEIKNGREKRYTVPSIASTVDEKRNLVILFRLLFFVFHFATISI